MNAKDRAELEALAKELRDKLDEWYAAPVQALERRVAALEERNWKADGEPRACFGYPEAASPEGRPATTGGTIITICEHGVDRRFLRCLMCPPTVPVAALEGLVKEWEEQAKVLAMLHAGSSDIRANQFEDCAAALRRAIEEAGE